MANVQTTVQYPNGSSTIEKSTEASSVVHTNGRHSLSQLPQTLYDVMVEKQDSAYIARVLFWPQEVIIAQTRADALAQAQAVILKHLSRSEFVTISIDPQAIVDRPAEVTNEQLEEENVDAGDALTGSNHPWAPFAGMYKDHPEDFEEFQAEIARYRDEIDREMGMGKYMDEADDEIKELPKLPQPIQDISEL